MSRYQSNNFYEKDYQYRSTDYRKPHERGATFVPSYDSEMARYKTKMCPFMIRYGNCTQGINCIYAHSNLEQRRNFKEPIPIWVKDVYQRIWRKKHQKNCNFDSKPNPVSEIPRFQEERRFISGEDEEDKKSSEIEKSPSQATDFQNQEPLNYAHSVQTPIVCETPVPHDSGITDAYRKLKIENLDLQATIAKLHRDKEELEQKLQESSKMSMESESPETDTIQDFNRMVKELQEENSRLKNRTKELLSKGESKSQSSDVYYKIILHAINQLEEVTRSYLTKKLMNYPVLTPSLTIVDKQDVFNILDHKPEHPYNRDQEFQKAKTFPPMKDVVDLRYELKRMVEEQESNDRDVQVSGSNSLCGDSEEFLQNINQLESRVIDRNDEIKRCNLHKKELECQIHNCRMKISELQNELSLVKKCHRFSEDGSHSNSELDMADHKSQIAQLQEDIKRHKIENMRCKTKIIGLQQSLAKLEATNEEITQKNQEVSDLKKAQEELKQFLSEMEQKVESLDALKQKIQEEKQEIKQELSDKILALEQDVARGKEIITNQKKHIDDLSSSEIFIQQKKELEERHSQLCFFLETMLYCKETNEPMKTPCFTPSGNTVDKEVMEMWIQDGQKDPWNGKPCLEVTNNLLAEDLGILLEQYKAKSQV